MGLLGYALLLAIFFVSSEELLWSQDDSCEAGQQKKALEPYPLKQHSRVLVRLKPDGLLATVILAGDVHGPSSPLSPAELVFAERQDAAEDQTLRITLADAENVLATHHGT